jgi:hypothetical protein
MVWGNVGVNGIDGCCLLLNSVEKLKTGVQEKVQGFVE